MREPIIIDIPGTRTWQSTTVTNCFDSATGAAVACSSGPGVEHVTERVNDISGIPFRIAGGSLDAHGVYVPHDVTLDASQLTGDYECAITLKKGSVELSHLKLLGVPDGKHAVCVEGVDNNVFDHFTIFQAGGPSGGDGFVFKVGSNNNWIMPDSSIQGVAGKAIRVDDDSESTGNRFVATNRLRGATDKNGLSVLDTSVLLDTTELLENRNLTDHANAAAVANFTITAADHPENFFASKVPMVVQIWGVTSGVTDQVDPTRQDVLITGAVVRWDKAIPTAQNDPDFCSAPIVRSLERVQVYSVNNSSVGGFYGYVSELNPDSGFGLLKEGDDTGAFNFNLPKETGTVILVPELTGGTIAPASQLLHVADDPTQAQCPNRYAGGSGGTSGGGGQPGGGSSTVATPRILASQYDCMIKRHLDINSGSAVGSISSSIPLRRFDTDGDGIPDDVEDRNHNCVWDHNGHDPTGTISDGGGTTYYETNYFDPDTDHDLIPDGMERNGDLSTLSATSAPLNPDQDGDGKIDGLEDRNFYFTSTVGAGQAARGLLYRMQSFGSGVPISINGDVQYCDLGNAADKGVRYDWYELQYNNPATRSISGWRRLSSNDFSFEGSTATSPDASGDDTRPTGMELLACKSETLSSPANFNGTYDRENLETYAYDPDGAAGPINALDSDNDGFCDGDNRANCTVATAPNLNDACPTLAGGLGSTNGCPVDGSLPCIRKAVFYRVDPKYVNYVEGAAVSLRTSGPRPGDPDDGSIDDSIPDIFQIKVDRETLRQIAYGDLDQDGIPDVFENPDGECGPDPVTHLQANLRDSDGDTFIDGPGVRPGEKSDVCPGTGTRGDNDNFVEGAPKSRYSCGNDTAAIYRDRPNLAFFLDRDSDNLYDAWEDRNQDGQITPCANLPAGGLTEEMLKQCETDPLDNDSDHDRRSDFDEVTKPVKFDGTQNIYTNPNSSDSDHDGISDGDEDRNGDGVYTLGMLQGSEGCPGALTVDTDPTDADTDHDGISDGVEIVDELTVGQDFLNLIKDPTIWDRGGIDIISNPRSDDSDGDGLKDGEETPNGIITYQGSNPCMADSDGDSILDKDEKPGCRLNPDLNCTGNDTYHGVDSDADGLPDAQELKLGTDPHKWDSDGDGLSDGEEDANHNGIFERNLGETNPLNPDTDGDGLSDGGEKTLGTNPLTTDTDGDCIPDGLEDANHNFHFDVASETNPLSTDTDGDGLPDGKIGGIGEDMNCNGILDTDPKTGKLLETDPRQWDTDHDGISDWDETHRGGRFNLAANLAGAVSGPNKRGFFGCSVSSQDAGPDSMMILFGLILVGTRLTSRRVKLARRKG